MRQLVAEVLAAWREAERVASSAPFGPERERAEMAVDRLRSLYHELMNEPDELGEPDELRAALERYRVHSPAEA